MNIFNKLFNKFQKPTFRLVDIGYLYFRFSTGNMMHANVIYKLEIVDGVYRAMVKQNLIPDEKADFFDVDKAFVDELLHFLVENGVEEWNGFKESDLDCLDGYDFDLYIHTTDGKKLSAVGYMIWPNNYETVKKGLCDRFMSLYPR